MAAPLVGLLFTCFGYTHKKRKGKAKAKAKGKGKGKGKGQGKGKGLGNGINTAEHKHIPSTWKALTHKHIPMIRVYLLIIISHGYRTE
jgi:hypothetical protein